jgi:hypothetical protein
MLSAVLDRRTWSARGEEVIPTTKEYTMLPKPLSNGIAMIDKDIRFTYYQGGRKFASAREPAYDKIGSSSNFRKVWDSYAEHVGSADGPFDLDAMLTHAGLRRMYSASVQRPTGWSYVEIYPWLDKFSSGSDGWVNHPLAAIAIDDLLIAVTLVDPLYIPDLILTFAEPIKKSVALEQHTAAIREQTETLKRQSNQQI